MASPRLLAGDRISEPPQVDSTSESLPASQTGVTNSNTVAGVRTAGRRNAKTIGNPR